MLPISSVKINHDRIRIIIQKSKLREFIAVKVLIHAIRLSIVHVNAALKIRIHSF